MIARPRLVWRSLFLDPGPESEAGKMARRNRVFVTVFAALAAWWAASKIEAQDVPASLRPDQSEEGPEVAAVRKTAKEFKRAFDAGDAKDVAAPWTAGDDYTEADGEQFVGREVIAEAYAAFFRENPKAKIEVTIETGRVLCPNVAIEEGMSWLVRPGQEGVEGPEAAAGRYSALHVRDADGWKMASVTEWPTDPTLAVSLDDVAWLVGDWEIASGEATARVS